MKQEYYEKLNNDLKNLIHPTVKKVLRVAIKDNLQKEVAHQESLDSLLGELEHHYVTQSKDIFVKIRQEMMSSGMIAYSEYVAPKEDD